MEQFVFCQNPSVPFVHLNWITNVFGCDNDLLAVALSTSADAPEASSDAPERPPDAPEGS